MNPDKERLLRLAESEDGSSIQVGGLMHRNMENEIIKINRQWFTIPKGTVVVAPNGVRVVLTEDAIVFCQDTAVGVKEVAAVHNDEPRIINLGDALKKSIAETLAEEPTKVRRRPNKGYGAV